jgi:glycosyltransferase involved in cell wall biosynthesis
MTRIGIDCRKIADFGIGTYIRGLIGEIAQLARDDEEFFAFAPERFRDRIPPRLTLIPFDAPHYSPQELFSLGRAIARAELDLFHTPHYVAPITSTPLVITIHDLIHLHRRFRNPLKPLYARRMLARAVRKSARVLTVTEAVKRQIVSELGCDEAKVIVTPNGIDAVFTPDGLRAEGRYFLFAGNDKPHKNLDTLIEAFARLNRADVQLVLAGGAVREGAISAGFVEEGELAALYRGAIAVVQPSIEEGFGLPAAEAMACGAPVITSTAPALIEITNDAALHADAHDVDALANAMRRLLDDEALRASLAARGIERAKRFTWRTCAEKTLNVYRALL